MLPKPATFHILIQDKGVAFLDPIFGKRRKGPADEFSGNAPTSVFPLDGKVTQNTPSAFMPAQQATKQSP
jgi:hypothetical protein